MVTHDLPELGECFTYAQIVRLLADGHRDCICPRRAALALLGEHLIHTNTWSGHITADMLTTAAGLPDPEHVGGCQ